MKPLKNKDRGGFNVKGEYAVRRDEPFSWQSQFFLKKVHFAGGAKRIQEYDLPRQTRRPGLKGRNRPVQKRFHHRGGRHIQIMHEVKIKVNRFNRLFYCVPIKNEGPFSERFPNLKRSTTTTVEPSASVQALRDKFLLCSLVKRLQGISCFCRLSRQDKQAGMGKAGGYIASG
jgi:hypothetical protein